MESKAESPQSGNTNGAATPLGLFGRLSTVLGEIGRVAKNGENKHFNYKYVQEADLADHIRPLLSKQGIGILYSVESVEERPNNVTRVKVNLTLGIDGGEERTVSVFGDAQDKTDKGIYKAMTGAVKYFLFKTFLVSTGDDPEIDTDEAGNNGRRGDGKKSGPDPEQERLKVDHAAATAFKKGIDACKSESELDTYIEANKAAIKQNAYVKDISNHSLTKRSTFTT